MNTIDFWYHLIDPDEVINYWTKIRYQIKDKLIANIPINLEDIISIDPKCRWKMGADHPTNVSDYLDKDYNSFNLRNFQCVSCQSINNLTDLDHLNPDSEFEIGNTYYDITLYSAVYPSLIYENNRLISDLFIHQLLISDYLTERSDVHTIKHGFVCGHTGTLISKQPSIGSLKDLISYKPLLTSGEKAFGTILKSDVLISIINQLIVTLNDLEKYHLVLGNINLDTIQFDLVGRQIKPIINTLYNLSLMMEETGTRIIPKKFLNQTQPIYKSYESELDSNWFKIRISPGNTNEHIVYRNHRHMGLTGFNPTINIYMCILMLMSERVVFKTMVNDPKSSQWWSKLWRLEDLSKINKNLINIQRGLDNFNIYQLLSRYSLRKKVPSI